MCPYCPSERFRLRQIHSCLRLLLLSKGDAMNVFFVLCNVVCASLSHTPTGSSTNSPAAGWCTCSSQTFVTSSISSSLLCRFHVGWTSAPAPPPIRLCVGAFGVAKVQMKQSGVQIGFWAWMG